MKFSQKNYLHIELALESQIHILARYGYMKTVMIPQVDQSIMYIHCIIFINLNEVFSIINFTLININISINLIEMPM